MSDRVPSSSPLIDPAPERTEHALCLGRDGILRELDRLLFEEQQKLVRLRGEHGRGKSTLLASYLSDLEQGLRGAGPPPQGASKPGLLSRLFGGKKQQAEARRVPHCFVGPASGSFQGTEPQEVAQKLAEQVEAMYPECRDPLAAPATRLLELLGRVSETVLVPKQQRLVLIIDGLDAVQGPPEATPGTGPEPGGAALLRLLPQPLPRHVSVLCAGGAGELLADLGVSEGIDLDLGDPRWQSEAAVMAFWKHAAERLAPKLPEAVWREAAARAQGNLLHAALVRALFLTLPPEQRLAERVPRGLAAFWPEVWAGWQALPGGAGALIARGVALLRAARAPLPAGLFERVLGGGADLAALLKLARPVVSPLPADGAVLGGSGKGAHAPEPMPEWLRLSESLRAYLDGLPAEPLVAAHRTIVEALCPWPLPLAGQGSPLQAFARRYALRYGPVHRVLAGDEAGAAEQLLDVGFLGTAARELGAAGTVALLREVEESLHERPESPLRQAAAALQAAVRREAGWLSHSPEALPGLLYNRLICLGWSAEEIGSRLRWSGGQPAVRLAWPLQQDGSAMVRILDCGQSSGGEPIGLQRCLALRDDKGEAAVLVGRGDGTVALWALGRGGRARWSAAGHKGAVHALLRLPGGPGRRERALSAGADGVVKIWDLASGQEHLTVRAHAGAVHGLWALPDGGFLTGGSDGRVRLWDGRGTPAGALAEGGVAVLAVAALPDGRRLAASEDRQIRIWAADGRALGKLEAEGPGHTLPVSQLLPLADGRLVTASLDGTLKLWEVPAEGQGSPRVLATLRGHGDGVSAAAALPGGRLLSASLDGTLRIFDLGAISASGEAALRGVCEGHGGWVTDCALLPEAGVEAGAEHAVSVSLDGTLRIWELQMAERLFARSGHQGFVTGMVPLPGPTGGSGRLLSASRDRTLKLWDLATGQHIRTFAGHAASVDECAVLPGAGGGADRAVSASYDATLKLWDLESGKALATMQGHSGWVSSCAPLPGPGGADGQRVLSAAMDGTVRLWDAKTGQQLKSLVGHSDSVTVCAVLPDGDRVVSASADGTLRIWKLSSGQQLQVLHGHTASVDRCLIVPSPSGEPRILSASADSTLKLWDAASGTHLLTLAGHTAWISGCDLLPGRPGEPVRVVSASGDETLRVWDVASGQALRVLSGHSAPIYACAALPLGADGRRRVVSAGGDGALKLWDAESGECLFTVYGPAAGFFSVRTAPGWIFAGDVLGNVWMLRC